jgi:DNA-directed RNA polymerase specialized sigma subunit
MSRKDTAKMMGVSTHQIKKVEDEAIEQEK